MKHTSSKILLLLFSFTIVIFHSCQREKELDDPTDPEPALAIGSGCTPKITLVCGSVLRFGSQTHFDNTYNCLEAEYEAHCDAFELANAGLTEDQYNDLIDATGWNEEQTLMAFESAFPGYFSLRKLIEGQMDIFLENTVLDEANNPDDHYIDDDIERAMYNKFGQVVIGTILYDYEPDGAHFEVTNPSCSQILALQANPAGMIGQPGISYFPPPPYDLRRDIIPPAGTLCANEYSYKNHKDDCMSNRRFKYRLKFKSHPSNAVAKAKVRAFKKKSNGKYKRWRTKMAIGVDVHFRYFNSYEIDYCRYGYHDNESKPYKRRHSRRVKLKSIDESYGMDMYYAISSGDMQAVYDIQGGCLWQQYAVW
jgi:hypothetical protein